MGCCGCDNRTSVITGGVFAIIQCVVGIALAIYNLQIFYGDCLANLSDKGYFCSVLDDSIGGIRALLIIVVVLYSVWIISSVFLLMGNANNRVGYIRQWVIISTIVIICDIIFPGIIVGISFNTILQQYEGSDLYSTSYVNLPATEKNLTQQYTTLLLVFSRGGLITWCCDIALTVYASHRIREILNPPRTYVYTQAYPATSHGIVNPLHHPNSYPQSAFPPQNVQHQNYYLAPGQGRNPYEFSAPPPSYTSVKPPQ